MEAGGTVQWKSAVDAELHCDQLWVTSTEFCAACRNRLRLDAARPGLFASEGSRLSGSRMRASLPASSVSRTSPCEDDSFTSDLAMEWSA